MNLRIAVLIGLSSLLPLVTTAQPPVETPTAERRPTTGGAQPRARKHIGRIGDQVAIPPMFSPSSAENAAEPGISRSPAVMMATRSSFVANWQKVNEATGYRLDVSTSNSFNHYINGYRDLDVGNATSWVVSGLTPGVKYYYRVRAYNATGTSSDSAVTSAATAGGSGLIINATFDSSVLNKPNSAAIKAMINQAIAIYESLFSDPITVSILFRYATTGPDGSALGSGTLGESDYGISAIPWNTYVAALQADAKTSNDTAASASLPANALSTNIVLSTADGRAVGQDTPPMMFANGAVGAGGSYDGIVTLNSAQPFQFTRPTTANNYDALRATEHEIDEVLGLGSYINSGSSDLRPQDLFSWSSPGTRNITSTGSRYFSIDGGNTDIVGFNQDPNGDFGDWVSPPCPQANPYVQVAFACTGQSSDVTATSPEGINLDVIGYDLVTPASGTGNTANGNGALSNLTSGSYNTAMGYQALHSDNTGGYNTAIGFSALFSNTTASYNTANGFDALYSNTTGSYNTATGVDALYSNTTASYNTANGNYALFNNTTGTYNTATGFGALYQNNTASYNTGNGFSALFSNTTGVANTANGFDALYSNTTGSYNTANGVDALYSNTTASNNTANADYALFNNTTGSSNTANGFGALYRNTTGSANIALGASAGVNLTTGNNNIKIGNAGVAGEANTIRIGIVGTQSATFIAGISGTAVTGASVVVNGNGQLGATPSSERFKEEIKPMDKASEAILALRPVSFRYKREIDPRRSTQFGLIAEEVEKVNADLVARDAQGKVYTVRYEAVNVMLLNEFLKEHRKVQEQEETISQLRNIVGKHETAIAQQQKELQSTDAQQGKEIEALAARLKRQRVQIEGVTDWLKTEKPAPQLTQGSR